MLPATLPHSLRLPLALHMGVRTAETMTTSCRALEQVRAVGRAVSTAAAARTCAWGSEMGFETAHQRFSMAESVTNQ